MVLCPTWIGYKTNRPRKMRDGSEVQVVYLLKPGKKSQANMAMQQFSGLGYLHRNMLLCGIGKYLWIYESMKLSRTQTLMLLVVTILQEGLRLKNPYHLYIHIYIYCSESSAKVAFLQYVIVLYRTHHFFLASVSSKLLEIVDPWQLWIRQTLGTLDFKPPLVKLELWGLWI